MGSQPPQLGFVPFPHTLPTISEVPNFTPFPPLLASIPFTQLSHETSEPDVGRLALELPLESTAEEDIDAIRRAIGEMAAQGLSFDFPQDDETLAALQVALCLLGKQQHQQCVLLLSFHWDLEGTCSEIRLQVLPTLQQPLRATPNAAVVVVQGSLPDEASHTPSADPAGSAPAPPLSEVERDNPQPLPPLLPRTPFSRMEAPSLTEDVLLDLPLDSTAEQDIDAIREALGDIIGGSAFHQDRPEPAVDVPPHAVAPSAPLSNSIPFTQLTAAAAARPSAAGSISFEASESEVQEQHRLSLEQVHMLQLPATSTTDEDIEAIRAALQQLSGLEGYGYSTLQNLIY